ncbi:hypothetical protein PAGA_a3800 [Pseudoalteromonas agarivorans DSM 14585]|uniref:Uncharacterized protein n=1 Tax=Pseudoalteromonas agarivorans DSM 14585 TaxID=1312369 RepID=A0ACA8E0R2_9GAMM|nr:hypothetical protein PAGA_a3800 [Pseudoalteromonas agarivorans DSM 14585]
MRLRRKTKRELRFCYLKIAQLIKQIDIKLFNFRRLYFCFKQ